VFTTQSDAAGAFEISMKPETADRGQTTIVASAGAGCQAQVVIAVGTPAGGSTPKPTAAGQAGATTGSDDAPPRTDGVPAQSVAPAPGLTAWFAFILLSVGIAGLLLTRPARGR
jgi:hypothetical protein